MLTVDKIKKHIEETSFCPGQTYPMKLWTFNSSGLFSNGQEGFNLRGECRECEMDNQEIDNGEDLEFIAKAPEYIRFLLAELEKNG